MATLAAAESGAFPELTDPQIDALRPYGRERAVEAGEVLFRSGDSGYDFNVVLAGRVAIVTARDTPSERVVAEHGPRRFVGELNLLSGQAAYLDAVVVESGRVLAIPPEGLRDVLDTDPVLSEVILRAFLRRRERLRAESAVGVKLIGSRFSSDTRRLLEFVARNRLPYVWVDLERDPDAEALLRAACIAPAETPVVHWDGGPTLRNPSNAELAGALGLRSPGTGAPDVYDLAVVGAGPAGLAAAVYGASEGLRTVTLDSVALGGQAGTSTRIENYLGFPAGLSGDELTTRAALQAEKFGARLIVPCEVVGLREEGAVHVLALADGEEVTARAVIVATGASYRRLPVQRLRDLEGFGVFYAATQAEAQICAGSAVAIVGGGNSAGQAAVYLAERAREVHVLVRRDGLAETMSRYLVDQVHRHPRITLHPRTEVRALHGTGALDGVDVVSDGDGRSARLAVSGLFVFIGADPHTDWLAGEVALDDHGFVLTGADLPEPGAPLVTSRPGVLAVGDVRHGSVKRVASAVGEGSMAVRLVHEHLAIRT